MRTVDFVLTGALVLAASGAALACIWDRDTLRMETKEFPHVTDVIVGRFPRNPPAYFTRRLELAAERGAAETIDLASYDDAGVACDRVSVRGSPEQVILDVAESKRADLIVMGTHGRTGLGHLLLGSVAERVVRHASCPVMTTSIAR